MRNKPPASAKSYKAPALKGRRVLANNRKANVEKWELRRLEILIDSGRLLLNAIPRRGEENKGQPRGVPTEVKLCQPELRSDERTGADLCSKWKPTPACLKSPAFIPFPWCHYISSGPCAFSWQPPGLTTLFFFTVIRRWKRPEIGHICEMAHLWCGNKLDYSQSLNNGKNTSVWTITFKDLVQWMNAGWNDCHLHKR